MTISTGIKPEKKKDRGTYILNLLLSDLVNGLGDLTQLVGLVAVDQTGSSDLQTGLEVLAGLEGAELGQSGGLLDVLAGNLASGDLLEGVYNVLAGGSDLVGLAGDGDGEETGVGVGEVLGGDLDLGESGGGLAQQREARSPLDGGLTTQEGSQNGRLGLVAGGAKGTGAGESNDDGVAVLAGDALLTTEVLGGSAATGLELVGGDAGGQLAEELVHPLGQLGGVGAAGDNGDIGLRVGALGELSNTLCGQVLLVRGGGGGSDVLTETTVEGQAVDGVDGQSLGVLKQSLLLVFDEVDDELVELIGCQSG